LSGRCREYYLRMAYGVVSSGEPGSHARSGGSGSDPIRAALAEDLQKLRPGTSAEAAWAAAGVVSSALEEQASARLGFEASAFDAGEIGSRMARELERVEEMRGGAGTATT
jgi:hypothetical protein